MTDWEVWCIHTVHLSQGLHNLCVYVSSRELALVYPLLSREREREEREKRKEEGGGGEERVWYNTVGDQREVDG